MTDILDLIDNALADVDLGDDAMRWRPTPQLDPEKVRAVLASLGRVFESVVEGLKAMVAALGRMFADRWARIAPMLAKAKRLHDEIEAARRVRLRHMHSAYHHRKR